MKKFFVIIAVALFSVSFVGCNKDDDKGDANTGLATLTIGGTIMSDEAWFDPTDIAKVTANIGGLYGYAIAQDTVINAEFYMILPALSDNLLLNNSFPATITVSNKNVKLAVIPYLDTDTGYKIARTINQYEEMYWYANADTNITGTAIENDDTYKFIDSYNLKLKKGWNIVICERKRSEIEENTYNYTYKTGVKVTGLTWGLRKSLSSL